MSKLNNIIHRWSLGCSPKGLRITRATISLPIIEELSDGLPYRD